MGKGPEPKSRPVPDACPHCGYPLSRWEQVLLGIDRALMCKHCWYRILLDAFPKKDQNDSPSKD